MIRQDCYLIVSSLLLYSSFVLSSGTISLIYSAPNVNKSSINGIPQLTEASISISDEHFIFAAFKIWWSGLIILIIIPYWLSFLLLIIRISFISSFLSTHLLVKVKWQIILKMKEQWFNNTLELFRHGKQPIKWIETNKCLLYVIDMENDPK